MPSEQKPEQAAAAAATQLLRQGRGHTPAAGSMGTLSSISIKVTLIKPLAKSHIRGRARGSHDPWWEVSEKGPVCGPQEVD